MQTLRRISGRTVWILLGFCVLAPNVHAYLDPGSGSLMVQLLLAGVAGIGVALRVYWRRLRALFGKSKNTGDAKDKPSS